MVYENTNIIHMFFEHTLYSIISVACSIHHRALARKEKKFCILPELGNKTQLGVWVYCERCSVGLGGFDGWPGGKALEKLTIFSLKLV